MIYWNLEALMRRHGVSTAYALAKLAGISKPGALRVLSGAPIEKLDTRVLFALASAFGVSNPLTLLRYEP